MPELWATLGLLLMNRFEIYRLSYYSPLHIEVATAFDNAHDVALYMWGRSAMSHVIYKNGVMIPHHLYGEIGELEKFLENYSVE